MIRTVNRRLFVLVAAALVAAVATSAAVAAPGHGKFGHRMPGARRRLRGPADGRLRPRRPRVRRLRRPGWPGVRGARLGRPRQARPRRQGRARRRSRALGRRPHARPRRSSASRVSTLTADLKGGKTLAQEATAKGKTAADLIDAIVAARRRCSTPRTSAGWITDAQETALLAELHQAGHEARQRGPAGSADEEARAARDGGDLHRDQRLGPPGRPEGRQDARQTWRRRTARPSTASSPRSPRRRRRTSMPR